MSTIPRALAASVRRAVVIAAALGSLAVAGAAPPADEVRTAEVGHNIDWSYRRDGSRVRYRVGDVTLTFGGRREVEAPGLIQALLTVEMPGLAPVTLQGAETSPGFEHRAAVGRQSDGRPFVLYQSFSGGAHCCNQIQLVLPGADRLEIVDLGEWDGDYMETLPADMDGDGRLDFILRDDGFLYAFASYADSWSPPLVMNVVDGEAVDVSARPAFRPLFEAYRRRVREGCVNPGDRVANGACAAYVAASARAGRFDEAWAEMLRSYDRGSDWPLPDDCRSVVTDRPCPEEDIVRFDGYPAALRHFLVAKGYIER